MNTFNVTTTMQFNSVVIIDCLREDDLQTGRSLYNALRDLNLPSEEFQVTRYQVGSIADINHCLQQVVQLCRDNSWRPVLHFEAHGSASGFELTNERPKLCEWTLLIPILRAVNAASKYNLGVFFSACEGATALKPITIREAVPFQYLIGPKARLPAGFLAERASLFYRDFLASSNITSSFEHAFAGHPFLLFLAEEMLAVSYGRVLRRQSIGKARKQRIEELVNMAIAAGASPEKLQTIREEARRFSRPDPERFYAIQRRFLPGGVSFTFEALVDFLRAGKNGQSIPPHD
jgi:hypothetical protein